MSNPYCTPAQLQLLYDTRTVTELSDDTGAGAETDAAIQLCLDVCASELEAVLNNRYGLPLPLPVPAVLTKWVACKGMTQLYGRRSDLPKALQADIEWADGWLQQLIEGLVGIPNVERTGATPSLIATGAWDGSSRFDRMRGQDQSGSNNRSNAAHGKPGVLSGF